MSEQMLETSEQMPIAELRRPDRLFTLGLWTAAVLLAALAVPVFLPPLSTRTSVLTESDSALAMAGAVLAMWLLLAYPIWPGELLGRNDPRGRFWTWLLLRIVEVVVVLAVSLPFLLAGAAFSGDTLWRVAPLLVGLLGTAAAAIGYRYVHVAMSERFRAWALIDAVFFLVAPVAAGYVLLEFYHQEIGWCWLICPAVLARDLALDGLGLTAALVGLVGYGAVSALSLVLLHLWLLRHPPQPPPAGA